MSRIRKDTENFSMVPSLVNCWRDFKRFFLSGLGHDVLFTTRGLLHIDSLHISQQKSSTLVAYRRVDSDESDDECQIIVNTAGVPVQINSSVQLSGVYETD